MITRLYETKQADVAIQQNVLRNTYENYYHILIEDLFLKAKRLKLILKYTEIILFAENTNSNF